MNIFKNKDKNDNKNDNKNENDNGLDDFIMGKLIKKWLNPNKITFKEGCMYDAGTIKKVLDEEFDEMGDLLNSDEYWKIFKKANNLNDTKETEQFLELYSKMFKAMHVTYKNMIYTDIFE